MIHACRAGAQFPFDLAFYSLADPVHPRFISSYVPTSAAGLAVKPHENENVPVAPCRLPATERFTSCSSRNLTVLPDLAFVDRHSSGL